MRRDGWWTLRRYTQRRPVSPDSALEAALLTSVVVLLVMATVATLTLVALTLWRVVTSLRGLLHALTCASEQLNQALTDLPQVSAPAGPQPDGPDTAAIPTTDSGQDGAGRAGAGLRQPAGPGPAGPHLWPQARQRPRRRR